MANEKTKNFIDYLRQNPDATEWKGLPVMPLKVLALLRYTPINYSENNLILSYRNHPVIAKVNVSDDDDLNEVLCDFISKLLADNAGIDMSRGLDEIEDPIEIIGDFYPLDDTVTLIKTPIEELDCLYREIASLVAYCTSLAAYYIELEDSTTVDTNDASSRLNTSVDTSSLSEEINDDPNYQDPLVGRDGNVVSFEAPAGEIADDTLSIDVKGLIAENDDLKAQIRDLTIENEHLEQEILQRDNKISTLNFVVRGATAENYDLKAQIRALEDSTAIKSTAPEKDSMIEYLHCELDKANTTIDELNDRIKQNDKINDILANGGTLFTLHDLDEMNNAILMLRDANVALINCFTGLFRGDIKANAYSIAKDYTQSINEMTKILKGLLSLREQDKIFSHKDIYPNNKEKEAYLPLSAISSISLRCRKDRDGDIIDARNYSTSAMNNFLKEPEVSENKEDESSKLYLAVVKDKNTDASKISIAMHHGDFLYDLRTGASVKQFDEGADIALSDDLSIIIKRLYDHFIEKYDIATSSHNNLFNSDNKEG